MHVFCLNGGHGEKLSLELNEVLGFPDDTSIEGGYDIICTLKIDSGCYHVEHERFFSATGALYRFCDELRPCYNDLHGSAEYHLFYEDNLTVKVEMTKGGHAVVSGTFQEYSHRGNILQFEFDTDQTCLLSVIQDIECLEAQFKRRSGGYRYDPPNQSK